MPTPPPPSLLPPTPPNSITPTPAVDSLSPVPVPEHHACARARGDAPGSGAGAVVFNQGREGVRRKSRRIVDFDFIMDASLDPVQVALIALRIPKVSVRADGTTCNNARLMRWFIRQCNGDDGIFRDLVYQQWRENTLDGVPDNAAAAFQRKLNRTLDELRREGLA